MKFIKYSLLAFLISPLFLLSCNQISAQENSSNKEIVYEQDSLSKDIRQLTIQYRGELEEYRNLENLFAIAKDQYIELGTLASLEDAVQRTQEVMDARARVLRTYLRLLRFKLLSQTGIELPEKKAAEQTLLAAIQKIEQHQGKLGETLDKPKLNELSLEFEILIEEIQEAAYQSLALMSIGKLQTVHDKAISLRDDMEAKIATAGGALKTAERKRSFEETQRLLKDLKPEFDLVEERYAKPSTSGYSGIYGAIETKLGSIHSTLAKAISFLEELLNI